MYYSGFVNWSAFTRYVQKTCIIQGLLTGLHAENLYYSEFVNWSAFTRYVQKICIIQGLLTGLHVQDMYRKPVVLECYKYLACIKSKVG